MEFSCVLLYENAYFLARNVHKSKDEPTGKREDNTEHGWGDEDPETMRRSGKRIVLDLIAI